MTPMLEPVSEATVALLDQLFVRAPLEHVAIRLWDGTVWPDPRPRAATVVLNHPGALRAMLEDGTAKGLGEAYVRGDYEVEGDLEQAVEMAVALEQRPAGWLDSLTTYYRLHRLPVRPRDPAEPAAVWSGGRHTPARDRQVVSFHYDVSNDFYQLWLDPEMVYSCAYFETSEAGLAASAHGFSHGDLAVYQTLLAKPHLDGHVDLPLTRQDWYEG